MISRYGNQRIKRGLIHFFVGKGVSAVAGLVAMLLVVRGLSIADFARYSVLIALVELFTAISGLGLVQLVLRYVPEFYATYQTKALRELIGKSFGVRTAVLIACAAIAWAYSEVVSSWIGLAGAPLALEAFILVVIFRSSANFLSQILESTLHQGISQFAFSVGAVLRCIGMAWLVSSNAVSLIDVILVEALCDGCSSTIMFFGVILVLKERAVAQNEPGEIPAIPLRKMVSFALMAYLQHLAILPYGGNMNRLVGGNLFGELIMASFGFAQSLYEYAKRYFPTQFLIGMIRPIVVARYTATRDFTAAVALCEQAFQFNLSLLAGVLSLLIVDGESLLSLFSGGKYTTQSATLLICLLILFAFETQRLIIEVLTQVVERYDLMIPGNVLLSISVLGGIVGYQWIGAVSFPLANMASLICANGFVVHRLKLYGFKYSHDWRGSVKSIGILLASVLVGKISIIFGAYWFIALALTMTAFIVLFMQLKLHESRCFFRNLVG